MTTNSNKFSKIDILKMVKNREITSEEGFRLIKELNRDNEQNASVFCYKSQWERSDLNVTKVLPTALKDFLVFTSSDEVYMALKEKIKKTSGDNSRAIQIKIGKSFRRISEEVYEINHENLDQYNTLMDAVKLQDTKHCRIIYIRSDDGVLNEQLEKGIYSLLYLTQALMAKKQSGEIELIYAYTNTMNEVRPADTAINGFFRTLQLENPRFVCKTVEIIEESRNNAASLAELLLNEFWCRQAVDIEVRYEKAIRYIRNVTVVNDKPENAEILRKNGVYIITGGLGGLGIIFAEYLADKFKAKLILVGRSELDDEKLEKIRHIEALGSEVVYIKADISQRNEVELLVKQTKDRFKAINGVIHTAGIYKNGFIINKTREDFENVFASKVYGTVYLDEVMKDEKLDFFVLFSSLAGVTGKVGQSDYTYANCFLDSFSKSRELLSVNQKRSGRTISINWPLWQDGGMTLSEEEQEMLAAQSGVKALPKKEGIECFNQALKCRTSQMIVIYAKKDMLMDMLKQKNKQDADTIKKIAVAPKVLIEKTENFLKHIISEGTGVGVEKIDPQADMEEYGVDSILVNKFNSELEKNIGPMPKTLLFEYHSLDKLADYLVSNHDLELIKLFELEQYKEEIIEEPAEFKIRTEVPRQKKLRLQREERKLQRDLEPEAISAPKYGNMDIAIIGVSGRYPKANNLKEFWEILKSGRDCITEIPSSRWDYRQFYDPNFDKLQKGKMYCKWGGFLDNVEKFDPLFFNMSPLEAEVMDPQERIFLEVSWEALEDAGYTRKGLRQLIEKRKSADVGVFVGVTSTTYQQIGPEEWVKGNMVMPNSSAWSVANRVSYIFNFQGPSMPVDTACSSALTAIHLACESLRKGECSVAMAGGVNIYLHPYKYVLMSQMKMLSPTGRCHTFSDSADGFVPGEGAGSIVLKPLEQAIADGDNIYAVIKGTSVNHDGKTNGYMVPNPNAQTSLILEALKKSQINPKTISYIEAHGTGTKLGDPIEITALTKAFREYTKDNQYCSIGSAKSNIGHLEAAAGISAITKVLLQMKYKQIVPSIHTENLNSNIDFTTTPFYVQRKLDEWKKPIVFENGEEKCYPRRAGISSFGAGGSNAHIILEEYEGKVTAISEPRARRKGLQVVVLSARNEERLKKYALGLVDYLENKKDEDLSTRANPSLIEAVAQYIGKKVEYGNIIDQGSILKYQESASSLEKFDRLLLIDAFIKMGIFEARGKYCNKEQIKAKLCILPGYFRLFDALLDILADEGFIEISGQEITISPSFDEKEFMKQRKEFDVRKQKLIEKYPEIKAYADLLWVCIAAYPEVLTGSKSHMDVMFPNGSMELVESIYRGSEIVDYYNKLVAYIIKEYIKQRLAKEPEALISILEVGAGTGGTSDFILKEIKDYAGNLRYIYTDISAGFTQYGRKIFADKYPFTEFKVLDIEDNPEKQGFLPSSIDIIFGSNVIHATKRIPNTVSQMKKLMKTNGIVVINEVTKKTDSSTMTFGLTNGWWLYADEDLRIKNSPLLEPSKWKKVLEEDGFRDVKIFGLPGETIENSGQNIVIGECEKQAEARSLEEIISVADIAYTMGAGREAMEERLAFVVSNTDELVEKLKLYCKDKKNIEDVFKGNTKESQARKLVDGELGERIIDLIVERREFKKLAELWTSGADVNWNLLKNNTGAKRISLPVYPFDGKSYMVKRKGTQYANNIGLHPLIDEVDLSRSLTQGLVFKKLIKNSHLIVSDCKYGQKTEMPMISCIEIASAAVSKIIGSNRFYFTNVEWSNEMSIEGDQKELEIHINMNNNELGFSIQSASKKGQLVHAGGDIQIIENASVMNIQHMSIENIKGECKTRISREEFYCNCLKNSLSYGPYYQVLDAVLMNEDEALGILKLPNEFRNEADDFFIHPALMEGIMQTVSAFDVKDLRLTRPVNAKKIEVIKLTGNKCYVYIKNIKNSQFNIAILDEEGQVCVKIYDITLNKAEDVIGRLTYTPLWTSLSSYMLEDYAIMDKVAKQRRENILVIYSTQGSKLARELEEYYCNDTVYKINLGVKGASISEWEYEVDVSSPDSLYDCLNRFDIVDKIYFLGGIQTDDYQIDDLAALEKVQLTGLITLYRIIIAFARKGIMNRDLELRVITNNVHEVTDGEASMPFGAGLNGFVRNIVKEYPKLKAYCFDIDLKRSDACENYVKSLVNFITSENEMKNGEEFVLRHRKCYIRTLLPIKLLSTEQLVFRPNGVYMILGGLGSIGFDFACYLAETVQARLVLLGKGGLDEERKKRISRIEEKGGQVLYIKVDAAELDSMMQALETAKLHFGEINGVIHSAMSFTQQLLENVDEKTYIETLAPKIKGSVILHKLFAKEPIDFMMFFSSGQSFTGNAERVHYATACNFEDTYALYLKSVYPGKVKVINWGFWNSLKGEPIVEEFVKLLENEGVKPIKAEEGIEIVRRLLSSEVSQVCTYNVKDFVLELMGVDINHQIEVSSNKRMSLIGMIDKKVMPVLDAGAESFKALKELSNIMLLNVFQSMGVFQSSGEQYEKHSLEEQLGIIPIYHRLFNALLDILSNAGHIKEAGTTIYTLEAVECQEVKAKIKNIDEKVEHLNMTMPDIVPYTRLLCACMKNYPQILTGKVLSTDIIFPNSSMELVEGVYKGNAGIDYFNNLVAEGVNSYIKTRLPYLGAGEKIDIIEVGAGTGGTSALVFEAIKQYSDNINYVYTDVSKAFIQFGKKEYGSRYSFIEFKVLNLEEDIRKQGYTPWSFDVVIGANVLHATRKIGNTLQNVKTLLVDKGWLILNEATQVQEFTTLTFGLTEGWWLFDDEENRMKGSPLLSLELWKDIFKEKGYCNVVSLGRSKSDEELIQNVLVAESNGILKLKREKHKDAVIEPVKQQVINPDPPALLKKEITPAVKLERNIGRPRDTRQETEEKLTGIVSETLQIDREDVDVDRAFMDFGVDSILAAKITDLVNESLGTSIVTTDLFDYSSIKKLSEYICEQYGETIGLVNEKEENVLFEEDQVSDSLSNQSNQSMTDEDMLYLLHKLEKKELKVDDIEDILEVHLDE